VKYKTLQITINFVWSFIDLIPLIPTWSSPFAFTLRILIRERNCLPLVSIWVHIRFLLGFMLLNYLVFCVVLCFVGLRPMSCVPNFARDSRLSIRDCPFGFPHKYLEPSLSLKSVGNITNTDNNSSMPIRYHHMFTS